MDIEKAKKVFTELLHEYIISRTTVIAEYYDHNESKKENIRLSQTVQRWNNDFNKALNIQNDSG